MIDTGHTCIKGRLPCRSRWGNSLAVRLPVGLVQLLTLKEGDEVTVLPGEHGTIVLRKQLSRAEAMDRISTDPITLPAGFRFDRDEANAR
jgi:antitoxin MazE